MKQVEFVFVLHHLQVMIVVEVNLIINFFFSNIAKIFILDICGVNTTNSIVCQNDGICIENAEGEWGCNCTHGWTGPYCMLHMCGDDSLSSLMCAHEGTCIHSTTTGVSTCSCPPQWTGFDCSGMRCPEPDITCYNQVDFDTDICTPKGCDCLNDGYGADCRGVRCGFDPGRCYNGAVCIDGYHGKCSPCPPGVTGSDCSMSNIYFFPSLLFIV